MMTHAQQNLAWRMIYRLQELDETQSSAAVGDRMLGAIQKVLNITVNAKSPFRWISFEQGAKLIV